MTIQRLKHPIDIMVGVHWHRQVVHSIEVKDLQEDIVWQDTNCFWIFAFIPLAFIPFAFISFSFIPFAYNMWVLIECADGDVIPYLFVCHFEELFPSSTLL